MMRKLRSEFRISTTVIYAIVTFFVVLCVLPFINLIAISFSSERAIVTGEVYLWPVEWTMLPYKALFNNDSMFSSLWLTVGLTFLFTAIAMVMTVSAAFPLSRNYLPGRSSVMKLIVFTMFFSGGIIPDYLLVKGMHLTNTLWSLVLPGMISAFNLLIMVTFFSNIPDSLEESAKIDGHSDLSILGKIYLPLSLPALATLSLFYAVSRWNGFQDALMYITNAKLYPIQLKLYQMVMNNQIQELTMQEGMGSFQSMPSEGIKAASLIFGILPILLIYPFLQRYFVSGMTLGAVKE